MGDVVAWVRDPEDIRDDVGGRGPVSPRSGFDGFGRCTVPVISTEVIFEPSGADGALIFVPILRRSASDSFGPLVESPSRRSFDRRSWIE